MASQHWQMIRDGAPATWTKDMAHVAKEIAAAAHDVDLDRLRAGAVAKSDVPIAGDFVRGEWRDGLVERCCMSERAISRVLTELARAGYEMRVRVGVTKDGEPVYAAKGNPVTFAVRYLPPRSVENPVGNPQSPPNSATFESQSTPGSAAFDRQSPPLLVPKPAEFGGPDLKTDDDDARAAAAAALAEKYDWPLDHCRRVVAEVVSKSTEPVRDPMRYVVIVSVPRNPASWAPDAPRWQPKDGTGQSAGKRSSKTSGSRPPAGNFRDLCKRCYQPGHDAEQCPTLDPDRS
jgi:hypothetical protein